MGNGPVDDDDAYASDVADDQNLQDDLGEVADPATIQPDEGDAGQASVPGQEDA